MHDAEIRVSAPDDYDRVTRLGVSTFVGDGASVGFAEAVRRGLVRPRTSGRASRSEFWLFWLFCVGVNLISFIVFGSLLDLRLTDDAVSMIVGIMSTIVFVRRLHDVDRSGWWLLISFTVIGLIPLFVWSVRRGSPHRNRYDLRATVQQPTVRETDRALTTIDKVERLHRLRREGAITDEEFQALKKSTL